MSETKNYILRDDKVLLAPNAWWNEERVIAELKENNQQYSIEALIENFKSLEEKLLEVKTEFDAATDKIRVAGKVSRTKNYICNAKAIGDYPVLLVQLDEMEVQIKTAVDANLKRKEELCVAAEALLELKEWKDSTEKLRELQKEYKELSVVPDLKNEALRDRFEKAKDEFFKLKQASFESFEQDLLDNLSRKIELCEKAEALQQSGEWKKTTDAYQALNEEWKKIGMVPKHRNEELWLRFNTAKDVFFNRKREHIEEIKTEHVGNLEKKLELIAKAEAIKDSTDWKKTTDEYNALMEEWKKTGRVSQEKNDEVWNLFQAAKNHFFSNKDAHYTGIKVQLEDNYARKMAIVEHAESLAQTNDFDAATQEFQDMFEEWKKIGRIPKEYGDGPWERFLKAKRDFFDRKDAYRDQRRKELSKDIHERVSRNRSFYNRLSRDLQREEELLFDVEDRLKNLPPTLRSYEKREQYLEMMEEIKEKINSLREKAKEVKDKINQDEREMNYILRGPKKKTETDAKTVTPPSEQNPVTENTPVESDSSDNQDSSLAATEQTPVAVQETVVEMTPEINESAEPIDQSETVSEPQQEKVEVVAESEEIATAQQDENVSPE